MTRNEKRPLPCLLLTACVGVLPGAGAAKADTLAMTGVNLAGAEFGKVPGTFGKDYIYPGAQDFTYFAQRGFNTVRLPFRWERLQPRLSQPLDPAELARLDAAVAGAKADGLIVILDLHNYARYDDRVVGSRELPSEALADVWARLARHFADRPDIVFGLMNEPHDVPGEQWLKAANAAIAAIRAAGAKNLLLVPGTAWTGAYSWTAGWYGTANGTVMTGVVDPCDNIAIEVHQYLDANFSGTDAACQSTDIGVASLKGFTNWLRTNHMRGFLGEFSGGRSQTCLSALDAMLDHLEANADVWFGWTYWAAGPWWDAGDPFSVQPSPGVVKPQLSVLAEHAGHTTPVLARCRSGDGRS